jgi:hypothetical protein
MCALCVLACTMSFVVQQMLTKCAAETARTQFYRPGCSAALHKWAALLVGDRMVLFVEESNLYVLYKAVRLL